VAFAGLWKRWRQGEQMLEWCAIITTLASAVMAALHNRMPVILASEIFDEWPAGTVEQAAGLLRWYMVEELEV
jgi:putative SOS response-associated peptidase YedK